jgi:hypothetical protein
MPLSKPALSGAVRKPLVTIPAIVLPSRDPPDLTHVCVDNAGGREVGGGRARSHSHVDLNETDLESPLLGCAESPAHRQSGVDIVLPIGRVDIIILIVVLGLLDLLKLRHFRIVGGGRRNITRWRWRQRHLLKFICGNEVLEVPAILRWGRNLERRRRRQSRVSRERDPL